ncbi:MAG: FHA domain-containing protein [Streptosporangiales bacterium]|nr:FHA domain-containing protein [Streptosporangiales bacterium]
METDPTRLVAVRASDAERDRTVSVLRERLAEGRISQDTFVARLDVALHARTRDELDGLLRDLPDAALPARAAPASTSAVDRFATMVEAASAFSRRMQTAWRRGKLPRLVLPSGGAQRLTVGRSPDCDLRLGDDGVSRYHADFHLQKGRWVVVDLGSTNGTRVNGWRITKPTPVNVGDMVSFGRLSFQLADHL